MLKSSLRVVRSVVQTVLILTGTFALGMSAVIFQLLFVGGMS